MYKEFSELTNRELKSLILDFLTDEDFKIGNNLGEIQRIDINNDGILVDLKGPAKSSIGFSSLEKYYHKHGRKISVLTDDTFLKDTPFFDLPD